MGNAQFNSAKDGGDGSGRDDGPYGTYPETLTAPGAPGPFSDAGFAPALRGGDGRTAYVGGDAAAIAGAVGSAATAVGDDMDVESKTDEGEEEEVRTNTRKNNHLKSYMMEFLVLPDF